MTRALAIVVAEGSGLRFITAMDVAAAAAALGRPVALFLAGPAVAAVHDPIVARAAELGATVTACQTGMADTGVEASSLPGFAEAGGLVGFLAAHDGAELLLA